MRRALALALLTVSCNNDIVVGQVENEPPEAVIQFPDDLDTFSEEDTIEFRGRVSDPDGLGDLQSVVWTSDLDGEMASILGEDVDADGITTIETLLTPGTHTVNLEVADSEGHSGNDTITVVVEAADQLPVVDIIEPANQSEVFLDEIVDLTGSATDPNQSADTLMVTWTAAPLGGGTALDLNGSTPIATGVTVADWTPDTEGNFVIRLEAEDDDGNVQGAEISLLVIDPDGIDGDNDGYTPNEGDCDDDNPDISPGDPEICNNIDDDCNFVVDDKDIDGDDHIDDQCVNYPGSLPVDDCNDGDGQMYPGAPEQPDGISNDCDLAIDEGLDTWDADGDCACPATSGTCSGSSNSACTVLILDDCDDNDAARTPANTEQTCNDIDDDCDDLTLDKPDVDGDLSNLCDDCDDDDPNNYPGNTEACDGEDNDCDNLLDEDVIFRDYYPDDDGDGYGNATGATSNACSPPQGFSQWNTDCDDTPVSGLDVNPGETEVTCNDLDDDCDAATLDKPDLDGDGSNVCDDCDDDDPGNEPGGFELCDGEDNNCDGVADDGWSFSDYWPDGDKDGEGDDTFTAINDCASPSTGPNDVWVNNGDDCDDADPDNFTGNAETCDGEDNDCTGVPDDNLPYDDYWPDGDKDGEGDDNAIATRACANPGTGPNDLWVANNDDCDDADPDNYSTNSEVCDGRDNDCVLGADNGLNFENWYADTDLDDHGDPNSTPRSECGDPTTGPTDNWINNNTDCDDTSALANPDITVETTCDDLDNDCDVQTLDKPDGDLDTSNVCDDCDDNDSNNWPGNTEDCDGVDNTCDDRVDEDIPYFDWFEDRDGDLHGNPDVSQNDCAQPTGFVLPNDDCNDDDPLIYGTNPEVCDGVTNDCDAFVDEECPTGVTVGAPNAASSSERGGFSGTDFEDYCPAGQVLIGMNVRADDRMNQIQGICGTLNLVTDTSGVPYSYSIDRTAGDTLTARGGTGGFADSETCPADQVIVGYLGRSGAVVDSVQFQCGALSIDGSTAGNYSVSYTLTGTSRQFADDDGGVDFAWNCPDGTAVTLLRGRYSTVINRLGVGCAEIRIDQPLAN